MIRYEREGWTRSEGWGDTGPLWELRQGKHWRRHFDSGAKLWGWHHPTEYWDLCVDYCNESATGRYWSVRAAYTPDPREPYGCVEIWASGETRKEAFKAFRKRVAAFRSLVELLDLRGGLRVAPTSQTSRLQKALDDYVALSKFDTLAAAGCELAKDCQAILDAMNKLNQ